MPSAPESTCSSLAGLPTLSDTQRKAHVDQDANQTVATIAEAESIVPVGMISPDSVITPGVLVHVLVAKERAA
jgi:acyl CoA:acetate/3-ketoacid CoA transferase alpha subunit